MTRLPRDAVPCVPRVRQPRARAERRHAPDLLVALEVQDQAPAAVAGMHGDVHVALGVVVAVAIGEDVGRLVVAGRHLHAAAEHDVPAARGGGGVEHRHACERRDVAEAAGVFVRARFRAAGPWRGDAPRRLDPGNAGDDADARRHLVADRGGQRILAIDDIGLLGLTLDLVLGAPIVLVRNRGAPRERDRPLPAAWSSAPVVPKSGAVCRSRMQPCAKESVAVATMRVAVRAVSVRIRTRITADLRDAAGSNPYYEPITAKSFWELGVGNWEFVGSGSRK